MAKEIELELRKSHENLLEAESKKILPENNENEASDNKNVEKSVVKKQPPLPVKTFAKPMFNKTKARDDPNCPSEFNFETLAKSDPKVPDKVLCSRLILEIAHLLFCRQWKMVSHSSLPQKGSNK
jgi:hypothetical protein